MLEETHDAVGDTCAVAFRFAVDEMLGAGGMQATGEGRDVVEMLAELPDLWDVNVAGWSNDSATTRLEPQDGYQMQYVEFVKQITSKPVVGTGRLTSPDAMVSLIKRGVLDLIGAARPSIADPFLPRKIEEGRTDEIRECIGCNICVAADNLGAPIRCTQNPTMGEEWRRGWHPEIIAAKGGADSALVIGAGPAGLECAMQLARRGYEVTLAEAGDAPGGRVLRESALPGLAAWKRVVDYRLNDLSQRANAQIFLQSEMTADQVIELGIPNVFVATGGKWLRDGRGRSATRGIPADDAAQILTPDDVMAGRMPGKGPVVVYDDDQGYLAGVLAELLAGAGHEVIFVTPATMVSPFTEYTLEQPRVQARLIEMGVQILTAKTLAHVGRDHARLACIYTGGAEEIACAAAVLVTERRRETALHDALRNARLDHLELIGDAAGPGLIADAVYSGHMAARNFERASDLTERDWYRRELIDLADGD